MPLLWFVLIAAAVAFIGIFLARASDRLGEAMNLERSVTGFLMLAAATSLPELVVSWEVAEADELNMAVGSLLGSCLMNLLILAGIDLSKRRAGRIFSRRAAAHALAALASILMAAIVAFSILLPAPPLFERYHWGSVLLVVSYVITFRLIFIDRKVATEDEFASEQEDAPPPTKAFGSKQIVVPALMYAGATAGILMLAPPLARSSDQLAELFKVSGTFFGAVFLALVTSLPEAVTTVEATRMNADDLAIGNILGSNTFNLLILVALDFVHEEPLFSSLPPVHAIAAIGIIVTTTIATMGLLYRVEKRAWYMEPDAIGVMLSALAFFYLMYAL